MKFPVMEKWGFVVIIMVTATFVADTCAKSSGLHSEQSAPPAKVQMCREACLKKVCFFL